MEHGVTEEVWGVDLVELMLLQAAEQLPQLEKIADQLSPVGHAIQARVYAENPTNNFLPSAGLLSEVSFPSHEFTRVETWVESGIEVPALFDPMIAKIICSGSDRSKALQALDETLDETSLYGIETNLGYVKAIGNSQTCIDGHLLTRFLKDFSYHSPSITVLSSGTQTTLQDYPARVGYWHVGIPPSGPMDHLSFQHANSLVGNSENEAGLEITLNGPSLQFHSATTVAVTGAQILVELNGKPAANAQAIHVKAGDILKVGKISGAGARAYLAVYGGIKCPKYLGSCSTFTLGQFGGHNGRSLTTGDTLHFNSTGQNTASGSGAVPAVAINDEMILRVIYGPHGAPDFFTPDDILTFFETTWEVHYNSSRTGVRLIGPKPEWARESGGEAGLHPSNIHDNAYAIGAVDFTGDMPVILGPDGPSLGGFVCPVTVISADLWKLGQLKAGAKIKFEAVTIKQAVSLEKAQLQSLQKSQSYKKTQSLTEIQSLKKDKAIEAPQDYTKLDITQLPSPILKQVDFQGEALTFRPAGDHYLLIELGPMELSIERRFKMHALMRKLEEHPIDGVSEMTPGIRSLQLHYDSQSVNVEQLINHVAHASAQLSGELPTKIPSRIVRIPLSWDDPACQLAIEKYTQSVRPNAPWCPSNLEFIRRINGLPDIQAVKATVFNASYLVMGLGDVYLGAPVATPIDPRHRLVTTKYNPARTWTAENSVGIGGAYMCVYGMEGPGGYQFVGRTLQMWNRYRTTREFSQPWLLRFFDQIQFYEVSADELTHIRKRFPLGQYPIEIIDTEFDLGAYHQFLTTNQQSIDAFTQQREQAYAEELQHWQQTGQLTYEAPETTSSEQDNILPADCSAIESPASGNVWKLCVSAGEKVKAGQVLAILESMKMEIDITAEYAGTVDTLLKNEGQMIAAGETLLWLKIS